MELLLLWILFGIVAAIIGSKKGAGCAGFILGMLLGPFGIIIALFITGDRKTCPFCRELIHQDATVCSHCQRDLSVKPPTPPTPAPVVFQPVLPPPLPPPPPPKPAEELSIPCPLCGKLLRVSTLKQGENWCIHCFEKFIAE